MSSNTSIPTSIRSFLQNIKLEQYYDAILETGATDQDLPQILQFNEQELSEFLSMLNLLPFHSIKLKKNLRELKEKTIQIEQIQDNNNSSDSLLTELTASTVSPVAAKEFIASHATIYGKKKNRPLTSYEEAINTAALQLALETPLLISRKGSLFELAKKKLLQDGYQYKRGSSRSKLQDPKTHSQQTLTLPTTEERAVAMPQRQQRDTTIAKRQENAQRMSEKRLSKIQSLHQQMEEAFQSRKMTEEKLMAGEYSDTLSRLSMEAELIRLEESKIKLNKEISKLKAQERKHQWYKKKKKHNTPTTVERSESQQSISTTTDEGFSSSQQSFDMTEDEEHDNENGFNDNFSVYNHPPPSSPQEYYNPVSSSQEYNSTDMDHATSSYSASSSSSASITTVAISTAAETLHQKMTATDPPIAMMCMRESDIRASLMHGYNH